VARVYAAAENDKFRLTFVCNNSETAVYIQSSDSVNLFAVQNLRDGALYVSHIGTLSRANVYSLESVVY
jgi:hypothetical protein